MKDQLRVLNIGCGPGRDMYEYLRRNPDSDVKFECVDLDSNAISFAGRYVVNLLTGFPFITKIFFDSNQKNNMIVSGQQDSLIILQTNSLLFY